MLANDRIIKREFAPPSSFADHPPRLLEYYPGKAEAKRGRMWGNVAVAEEEKEGGGGA